MRSENEERATEFEKNEKSLSLACSDVLEGDGASLGTTNYRYDPFGRRIQKSGPLGTTNYLYDGMNLIHQLGAGGTLSPGTLMERLLMSRWRCFKVRLYRTTKPTGSTL